LKGIDGQGREPAAFLAERPARQAGHKDHGPPLFTLAAAYAAAELRRKETGRTLHILDKPTAGLHFHDIAKLLEVLFKLRASGNTLRVTEHNLAVIKTADWIIDLGPEGGDTGGQIVAQGPPETVARCPASHTGQYLTQTLVRF
jgi:excinuclease ABC subunit A